MTGWRLGYAIVPKALQSNYLKLIQNSITHVNPFVQWAGLKALEEAHLHADLFINMVSAYNSRRIEIIELLENKKIDFVHPTGSFYFFIKNLGNKQDFVSFMLDKYKIAFVPGIAYGEDFSDYFRMSYAVDETSYQGFIKWLENEQ